MKQHICLIVAVLSLAHGLYSQTTPDSSEESPAEESATEQSTPQLRVRPVTWKQLVPNIVKDQKHIWTFPFRMGQGNNWAPALGVSAITVGLVAADPYNAPYFRRTNSFHRFNSIASANVSAIGSVIAPIGFYVAGVIRKDSYAKETALLAAEAIANAQILSLAMHTADRRIRPRNLPITGKLQGHVVQKQGQCDSRKW